MILQSDSDFEKYFDEISELQGYAVEVRYPNEIIFLSEEKTEQAIETAKNIRLLIISKMNITVEHNEIID